MNHENWLCLLSGFFVVLVLVVASSFIVLSGQGNRIDVLENRVGISKDTDAADMRDGNKKFYSAMYDHMEENARKEENRESAQTVKDLKKQVKILEDEKHELKHRLALTECRLDFLERRLSVIEFKATLPNK